MTRVEPEPGDSRERFLDFLAATSLANLCLLLIWRELLFADTPDRYWMIDFSTRHYLAALLNFGWVSAALYIGARAYRRFCNWPARAALLVGLVVALMAPANYVRLALKFDERELFQLADSWIALAAVTGAAVLVAWTVFRHGRRTLLALRFLLVVLSPFAALNVAQAAWTAATIEAPRSAAAEQAAAPASEGIATRVVWLTFDELDWRLGFEERPAHVRMPEFARLAEASVVAAAAEASSATMVAIPSLTTGRKLDGAHRLDDRRVSLIFKDKAGEAQWREAGDVFSEARIAGARTEIVGFYHPYCRVFAGEYYRCAAFPMDVAHMDPDEAVGSIMLSQLARLLPVNRRISAIWMYERIAARTASAVANPANDFIFAHVSVPHGPNIWSSEAESFTLFNLRKDGYLENLEVADRLLGEVRKSLEDAGLWEDTAIVATADHGWRHVDLIGQSRDRRVPLLVRFPGQDTRYNVAGTVDATTTVKRAVLGILTGEVRSPADLQSKLAREWRVVAAKPGAR